MKTAVLGIDPRKTTSGIGLSRALGLGVLVLAVVLPAACGRRPASATNGGAAGPPDYMAAGVAYRQTAEGAHKTVVVAAHAYAANSAGSDYPVLTTPPVNTPESGELALVQILTQDGATLGTIRDNMGNVYHRIGNAQAYADGKAGSDLFACANAKGGPGQTWSLVKAAGHARDEASLYVVDLHGASGIGAWGFSNTEPYGLRSPLTTTAAGSIVVSFWGPADYSSSARDPLNPYVAPPGWTLGGQNDNGYNQTSGAYAWIAVPAANTVLDPQWTSRKSVRATGSMWLVEAKP